MSKKLIYGLCFLFAVLMMSGPVSSAVAADTIKIGATEPLSGTFKDIGERYLDGVLYAAQVINESGGCWARRWKWFRSIGTEARRRDPQAQNLILRDGVKFFAAAEARRSRHGQLRQNVICFCGRGRGQHDRRKATKTLPPRRSTDNAVLHAQPN